MVLKEINNIKVINKNVTFADKANISNEIINLTIINDVKENEIEKCLEAISKNNTGLVINHIDYSNKLNKVFIYANKKINTKMWDIFDKEYSRLEEKSNTLNKDIDDLNEYDNSIDENIISLADAIKYIQLICSSSYDLDQSHLNKLNSSLDHLKKNSEPVIYNLYFDYESNKLFIEYNLDELEEITISKQDDKYIFDKSSKLYKSLDNNMKQELISSYNEHMNLKDLFTSKRFGIKSTTGDFKINMVPVSTWRRINIGTWKKYKFSIGKTIAYEIQLNHKSNNDYVINVQTKGNDVKTYTSQDDNVADILNRVCVYIQDCPECLQPLFYNIRQEEINLLNTRLSNGKKVNECVKTLKKETKKYK